MVTDFIGDAEYQKNLIIQPMTMQPANSETRRAEKSRFAAKVRRDRELEIMSSLAEALPVLGDTAGRLDKASIFRLSVAYLRIKRILACYLKSLPSSNESKVIAKNMSSFFEREVLIGALGGFLLLLSPECDVLYVSENVEDAIGLTQVEMLGRSLLDFTYPADSRELTKQLEPNEMDTNLENTGVLSEGQRCVKQERNFYVRLQAMERKKNSPKIRHSSFVFVHFKGHLRLNQTNKANAVDALLCVCRPVRVTPVMDQPFITGNMFMSRHNLSCAFVELDPRIMMLIGYEPSELLGQTLFQFHAPMDVEKLQACHKSLLKNGKAVSKCYRFLGKTGVWVWMKTRASLIFNTASQPQYIICQNYVVSEKEATGNDERSIDNKKENDRNADVPISESSSTSVPKEELPRGHTLKQMNHKANAKKTITADKQQLKTKTLPSKVEKKTVAVETDITLLTSVTSTAACSAITATSGGNEKISYPSCMSTTVKLSHSNFSYPEPGGSSGANSSASLGREAAASSSGPYLEEMMTEPIYQSWGQGLIRESHIESPQVSLPKEPICGCCANQQIRSAHSVNSISYMQYQNCSSPSQNACFSRHSSSTTLSNYNSPDPYQDAPTPCQYGDASDLQSSSMSSVVHESHTSSSQSGEQPRHNTSQYQNFLQPLSNIVGENKLPENCIPSPLSLNSSGYHSSDSDEEMETKSLQVASVALSPIYNSPLCVDAVESRNASVLAPVRNPYTHQRVEPYLNNLKSVRGKSCPTLTNLPMDSHMDALLADTFPSIDDAGMPDCPNTCEEMMIVPEDLTDFASDLCCNNALAESVLEQLLKNSETDFYLSLSPEASPPEYQTASAFTDTDH